MLHTNLSAGTVPLDCFAGRICYGNCSSANIRFTMVPTSRPLGHVRTLMRGDIDDQGAGHGKTMSVNTKRCEHIVWER
jgi:hypothetical protein